MPKPKTRWRLSKTLARPHSFRPIEDEDVPYVGVAYRRGALKGILPDGMSADEFKDSFVRLILERYEAAWTLFAETKRGVVPVGLAVGFWLHPRAPRLVMVLDALVWFPWASRRNKVESIVGFLDAMRREMPMIGYARGQDKGFMEMLAKHGLGRQVGTSYTIFGTEPATIWEAR